MSTYTVRQIESQVQWNAALRTLPLAHILQTWEWGEFKQETTGWHQHRLAFYDGDQVVAMASIGVRRVGPLAVMVVSKGPALDYTNAALVTKVFGYLEQFSRKRRAIWLKIDPDVIAAKGVPGETEDTPDAVGQTFIAELQKRGWRFSDDQVQFRNTITLDLTLSEDELLSAMSQNTRRKVRTGEKKGVVIRAATPADLSTLYELYRITGERDGFLTRPAPYYEKAWRGFMQAGLAHALIAEADGVPLAHVILFHFGQKCWYFYGASSTEGRDKMPNYALQWEAIKWAKAQGYTIYDMWGAPDVFDESDSMWGVYEFKRGFRGEVTRYIGAWDYAPSTLLYRLYTELMPRLRNWLRRRAE